MQAPAADDSEAFDDGIFAPGSSIRSVHREGVLLLGGGRALLLQLAHPAVAAGVAIHSDYSSRPFDRLLATLRSTLAIVYGTKAQAHAAALHVNRLHHHVRGRGYDAHDPALLLWVLATLIDTTFVMQERFVRPLTTAEAARYYEDWRTLATLFGLSPASMPPSVTALHEYFDTTLATLIVTDDARTIAAELFRGGPGLRGAMPFVSQLTSGLLPARIREQYGLSWGPQRESMLRALASVSRRGLPLLPARLHATPSFLLPSPRRSNRSTNSSGLSSERGH